MEWREQSTVSCEDAFLEAQRWVEEVTKKRFGSSSFRSALENGVLLCDLINRLKPGIVKRVNRLSTPIAGLDNVNVFLRACGKLGLKEAQLFHPGDLQDLSSRVTVRPEETNRRLKNVLITIYWLGRKAQADPIYNGPYLNLKAFEGLLGLALSKALEDPANTRVNVRDSGFSDSWYAEKEEPFPPQPSHRREDSLDSLDSVESRTLSISSDTTLKGSSEGCGSDAEADLGYRMTESKDGLQYRRSLVIEPKAAGQFNQFLPTKDKPASGYVPAPLRKKRGERQEENRRSWASPMFTEEDGTFASGGEAGTDPSPQNGVRLGDAPPATPPRSPLGYGSESDSDADRPDPDLVLDDLASRRFRSPSPLAPPNFAVPLSPLGMGRFLAAPPYPLATVPNAPHSAEPPLSGASPCPPTPPGGERGVRRTDPFPDSDEDSDGAGYADPVQDDLYLRKVGLNLQPSACELYDRFLPKFWTPEEELHVHSIRVGSRRRPWYRKIQGFSRTASDSSSEDSDCDIHPWLVPCSRPPVQSDTPPSHPHAPDGSAHPQPPVAQSSLTQSVTASPPFTVLPYSKRPPKFDPSAVPRLVRCQGHPRRGDPLARDALPDLENDDMFARRTGAYSCADLRAVSPQSEGGAPPPSFGASGGFTIVTQPRRGAPVLPDVLRDDLLFRKVSAPGADPPLSGGPDTYTALPLPAPDALPDRLRARLLCQPCPPAPEEGEEAAADPKGEGRPRTDDMSLRRLGAGPLKGAGPPPGPAVPTSCSEEDLQKWQSIREASRVKHKKRLMVERRFQRRYGCDGSKSMNDITVDPEVVRQVRHEELAKMRAQLKENEDQWQDDLSKWKNRRRTVNSSIVKKKEEREQIEQITGGGSTRRSKTFKEMEEEREGRGHASPTPSRRLQSASEDVPPGPAPQLHARKLPGRSYTVDSLYSSQNRAASPLSAPVEEDREHALGPELDPTPVLKPRSLYPTKTAAVRASPTSAEGAEQTDGLLKTQTKTWSAPAPVSWSAPTPAPAPTPTLTATSAKLSSSTPAVPAGLGSTAVGRSEAAKPAEPRFPFSRPAAEEQGPGAPYRRSGAALAPAVSASLPRSYQRPDSSRLTSVVAPRPFGTQATRIASLPRTFATDDSQKRVNGETAVPSRYRAFMTEEEARAQASSAQSSEEEEEDEEEGEEEEEEEEEGETPAPLSSTDGPKLKPESALNSGPKIEDTQEVYCDMRISLNQKPNSGRDFGFQTNWDSTGAFIKSIQEGSPAELCQLRAGDEVLVVSGLQVSELSYDQWKASLEAALQKGCLVMDIRRHGRNSSPDKFVNTCRELSPQPAAETATRAQESSRLPGTDVASKGMNGGFRDDSVTMRNKDSEPISLKNFKRRSEFFEQQGGAESAISDLQVPPVSSSSNRWSWDLDEERRRQEKWQKEQERLLQEKYQRDQEKLEEEWRRAQQEAVESAAGKLEVDRGTREAETRSLSPYSPLSPLSQATPPPTDQEEEERERQEVEQQLQREEEERLRREEELRLQRKREEEEAAKRREAELKERKRREDEERLRRAEELRLQRKREEEEEERRRKLEEEERRRRRQKAEEEQRREQEALQEQWAGVESYGFAKILPEMSRSDRAKSKSTPDLDEVQKEDARGASSRQGGMAQWLLEEELQRKRSSRAQKLQAASELEAERRNILNAMKYRNPERVVNSGAGEASWSRDSLRRAGQPLTPAENDRQLILEEMKKKTLLLTDSSWIRQRSASMNKEPASPASPAAPIRRGDSLDNLDTDSSWRPPSWSAAPTAYSRPQSAAPGSAPSRGYTRPASSTLPPSSTSAAAPRPSSWALNPPVAPYQDRPPSDPDPSSLQRTRSVSGKKICTFCDTPLGKGAAMIIESLGLCYHLSCFKCSDCKAGLGGSETGAEVRIRNQQLYCNSCYIRFKTGQRTTK